MTERFGRWLMVLLQYGEIPLDQQPLFKNNLNAAKGAAGEALLSRAILPFERRFGDASRSRRQMPMVEFEEW